MKKSWFSPILLTILFFGIQTGVNAQFFKDILNSVKQTAQGRANSKADQTTNKALDKVDSGTQLKGTHSNNGLNNIDTSSTSRLMNSFARAAAANPNDTSSADLTMKALGIFASGPTVSRQDSVAAISSYKTANGGSGLHYIYLIVSKDKKGTTGTDTSQIYFTNNGEGRGEIEIPVPGYKMPKMITLGRANARRFSVMLHPDKNTYSLNVIDTTLSGKTNYQVTRIGTETVQGYSCIHSKLVETLSGLGKTTTTDVWTSTEIPGYALYKKMTAVQNSKPGMAQALENAGCGGFPVKMDIEGSSSSMVQTLIKAEETHLPASLFQIPAGYTESDENVMSGLFQSAGKNK